MIIIRVLAKLLGNTESKMIMLMMVGKNVCEVGIIAADD
jgi:hypothetical protein